MNKHIEEDTPLLALKRAIKAAGGQSALARKCNIRQQTIYIWLKMGRVPAERVLQIEKAIENLVTRYELRPDIYPRF